MGALSAELAKLVVFTPDKGFSMAVIPSLQPDADDCKLHNSYDVQSCILAGVSLVLGAVVCFYGEH